MKTKLQKSYLCRGRGFIGALVFGLAIGTQAPAGTTNSFTFTKLAGPPTYIQAGTPGLDVLIFEMDCITSKSTALKRIDFNFAPAIPMSWGNVPGLTNFRLIYFPNGLKHPGSIIGSNSGASFDGISIGIDVPSFILAKNFSGKFALRADVTTNFTTSYAFTTELIGVTVNVGGTDQPVSSSSLPLIGDTFHVVQN